jgi:hypothetical protein
MAEKRPVQNITVKEFVSAEFLHENEHLRGIKGIDQLLSRFNGGSFMECHQKVFQATGVWIEELVPVFQRFDAIISTRNLNPTFHG